MAVMNFGRFLTRGDAIIIALIGVSRAISVFYMIISDCDEVFNYWEPLNFLLRGFGKQTWEYSPEYSIRSWAYLIPYYLVILPYLRIALDLPVYYGFYAVRAVLALMVFIGEIKLYFSIKTNINHQLAYWFGFFSAVSTGMTHGTIALLPSSLGLACTIYATSQVVEYCCNGHMANAWSVVFWYSLAGLLGWPFTLVLAVPLLVYVLAKALQSLSPVKTILAFVSGCAAIAGTILAIVVGFDSTLYQKLSIVPLNIFLYNVLHATEEAGPNIFGVEPFIYYPLNLALNFNIIFALATAGMFVSPVLAFCSTLVSQSIKKSGVSKHKNPSYALQPTFVLVLLAPMLIWCVIFASQPHKEERFLYPIYPLVNVSAAVFVFLLNSVVQQLSLTGVFKQLHQLSNVALILATLAVSASRTVQLIHDYSAPLYVYDHLPRDATGNVCVGREWYRYPSSFFLPSSTRLRFVRSGFNGLLPGDFKETGLIESISSIPRGMNNKNLFDEGKISNLSNCDYYVDIDEPTDSETGEPSILISNSQGDAILISPQWKIIHCEKFINNDKSSGLGRVLALPKLAHSLLKTNLQYHNYCLLERVEKS